MFIAQPSDNCVTCLPIHSVASEITVAKRPQMWLWSKDPVSKNDEIYVYIQDTRYLYVINVVEFQSESDFQANMNFVRHTLPVPCHGEGLVYGGKLYCNEATTSGGTKNIVVIHMTTTQILGRISFSNIEGTVAGHNYDCAYKWGGSSSFDVEADESGLWVIWGQGVGCKMAVSKINTEKLTIEQTWFLDMVYKTTIANTFVVCGVVYVVDYESTKFSTNYFIRYKYDTHSKKMTQYNDGNGIPLGIYPANAGIKHGMTYDAREKALYICDIAGQRSNWEATATKMPLTFD